MPRTILALDQGTTSSRSMLFDATSKPLAKAQEEFPQLFPRADHVEHDPEAIWETQLATARAVIEKAEIDIDDIAGIGITNQRETTILWEQATGKPVANAIVWQSRITAPICDRLKADGHEQTFRDKTGLLLDPYFSGTKVTHLLDSIDGLRSRAEQGEILFGTVDTFLAWRLSGGNLHVTDVSNASRTLMFNIHDLCWDDELLGLLNVPRAMLPEVCASSMIYGETDAELFGRSIPIAGIAGDQHAATFGQACFESGDAKNTYGTGCFVLMNTGSKPVASEHGLLTTVGWQIGDETVYCLEGAIFIAGAAVQWLRDGLQIIGDAGEIEALADEIEETDGVYFVPALTGLGAPHWDPQARGTIVGLTRGSGRAHLARAALEAMAYQTRDVLDIMKSEAGLSVPALKVDGGATANNLLMQFQADILDIPVHRAAVPETTALGAAYLAGLATGVWTDQAEIQKQWNADRQFKPDMPEERRERLYAGWQRAVDRSLQWAITDQE